MKNIFFSMSTRRLAESMEGLNSSLALAAGDLWSKMGWPMAVVKGLDQWSPNFFVRGAHMLLPNNLRAGHLSNVIVLGYVTFYQITNFS